MRTSLFPTIFVLIAVLIAGCAGAPSWKGMSESEIAAWKAMDVNAETAQKFTRAGLSSDDVDAWRDAGLSATDAILAWNEAGWKPEAAASWIQHQFSVGAAKEWAAEKFSASEARNWFDAGFSLKQAVENRNKGLTPVR